MEVVLKVLTWFKGFKHDKKMNLKLPLALFFLALVGSCGTESEKAANRKQMQEGMEANKVKRVLPAEIMDGAYKLGDEITNATQQSLTSHLQEALSGGDLSAAISYCNLNALPITDSLAKKYNAAIRRVSLKTRNPKNQPNEMERTLLDAYVYNQEQGLSLTDNVQKLDEAVFLYNKPIVIKNALCLNCHGKKGETLSDETLLQLVKLYPNDEATGYHINDFRGMWSVELKKAEIVRGME